MSEHRRIKGDPRLGFISDELEGETCIECREQATIAYEDIDGLVHYCEQHDPDADQVTAGYTNADYAAIGRQARSERGRALTADEMTAIRNELEGI